MTAFPHCIKMPLDFLHTFSKCSFHESVESRVMTKNLVDFVTSISDPSTFRGLLLDQLRLLVNITQCVLSWLSFSPFVVHHWLMLTRLFCVTSLKVSASKPCLSVDCFGVVTTDTSARSSANPCRSLGILFLVISSYSLLTRFHKNGY